MANGRRFSLHRHDIGQENEERQRIAAYTMGRDISLFSGYDQKENRTTNYCLLMLRQVYDASPRLLSEVLGELGLQEAAEALGVRFAQQQHAGRSVPDGLVHQADFVVAVETKHSDWFHWGQIEEHVRGLMDRPERTKALLALSSFEAGPNEKHADFSERVRALTGGAVEYATCSFRAFIEAVRRDGMPVGLKATAMELEGYFAEANLLGNWRNQLVIVNCGRTMHEVDAGAYLCPRIGASYSFAPSRVFGNYRDKCTDQIREIRGIVDVHRLEDGPLTPEGKRGVKTGIAFVLEGGLFAWVHFNAGVASNEDLASLAADFAQRFRSGQLNDGVRSILLGAPHATEFRKDTKGGMIGTKRYFDVPDEDLEAIAHLLRHRTWSEL